MNDAERIVDEAIKRERQKREGLTPSSSKNGSASKPLLVIDPGNLPVVATQLRDALAQSGALYNRGAPVRITASSSDTAPIASPLTAHSVVRLAHDYTRPVKDGEAATLPDRVANMYLDMHGEWNLPKLAGISATPLLSPDGQIRLSDGYHAASGIYCHHMPPVVVSDRPTREQAVAALATIRAAFRTFPFADSRRQHDKALGVEVVVPDQPIGHDEGAFLNGLLTAVCRPSLWLAPGLILNAPSISGAGTGKGLLVRAIAQIAYGVNVRPFTPGNDRHEMDKRIVAEVIEGKPILAMDNVNSTLLRSNTLASLLTERPTGVRILGQSRMVVLEHASFIALTGNGLAVSEDLARRFLFSELDAQMEDPEQRPFRAGFLPAITTQRNELLRAALTIWRWGRQYVAGADDAGVDIKRGVTLGSFEQWGEWVRDPLLALGCPDPVTRIREIKERDPERQRVRELFAAWWEAHHDIPVRVSDLAPEVREIADPGGKGRQYLARAIQNLTGTRQAGYVLDRVGELPNRRKEGALYWLRQIASDTTRHSVESSAASASSATEAENLTKSTDDGARMPADAKKSSAGASALGDSNDINGLGQAGTDSADDADAPTPPTAQPLCAHCGKPSDHQSLREVGDGSRSAWLHRRCEIAWLNGPSLTGGHSQ